MNVWIPELGKVMMTLEVPKAGEVKENVALQEKENSNLMHFPVV